MIHHATKTAVLLLAILFLALAIRLAEADELAGKVVAVTDGDTVKVLYQGKAHKVRLAGIDAPERKQAFGKRAKEYASTLAAGKTVKVTWTEKDRYGRIVGVVILPDGSNLNNEMVKAGLAWWYRQYAPKDRTLERLENEAKAARRGLWADPKPIPPWEWRRAKRGRN